MQPNWLAVVGKDRYAEDEVSNEVRWLQGVDALAQTSRATHRGTPRPSRVGQVQG